MLVIRNYYGVPSPLCGPPLNIQVGDVIELVEANIRSSWWKVRPFSRSRHPTASTTAANYMPPVFVSRAERLFCYALRSVTGCEMLTNPALCQHKKAADASWANKVLWP